MALMDFIKKQFIDILQWTEDGDGTLAWRFPMEGMEIQNGGTLVVRESQMAVFVNEGQVADVFGPGTYKLTTQTLPVLTYLKNWDKLFQSPFKSDVYFFSTRQQVDQKWGTPQPISLRDSDLGLVRLRAFGQYTMQVADPKRFVDQIVGTQGIYTTAQIEDYLRGVIISRMTDVLGQNMKSIFDLPQLFDELGAGIRARVQDDFLAMGVALKQFMVVSINPTEETAKAIDERAAMGAIGNMDAYLKFKAAQAMGTAAASGGGAAGEGVGLGAGLGMGMGMAGMISNAMAGAQASQQAAAQASQPTAASGGLPPSVMTLEEAAAYLKVSPADIQALIDSGELKARTIGTQVRISKEAVDAFLAG